MTLNLYTVRDSTGREVVARELDTRSPSEVEVREEESRVLLLYRGQVVGEGFAPPEEPLRLLRAPVNDTSSTVVRSAPSGRKS